MIICAAYTNPVDIAMTFDKVLAARAFKCGDTTVVAVLTAPIFLGSERDRLKDDIASAVVEGCGGKAVVTFDTEVFRKIREDATEEEMQALLALARSRK